MGIVPGMPTVPFLTIAAIAGGMAYFKSKTQKEIKQTQEAEKVQQEQQEKLGKKEKRAKATRESVMETFECRYNRNRSRLQASTAFKC